MHTLVALVVGGVVFAFFCDVFVLFFLVVCAFWVLANCVDLAFWSSLWHMSTDNTGTNKLHKDIVH